MALSESQLRRYARNISLPQMGKAGQERLLAARVLIVGAGGLGSAAISYLSAAGIGHLGIADYDRVEASNLQRQILHETGDIGRLKTESARDRVEELNPDVKVQLHTEKIIPANAAYFIEDYEVVIDGSDNFATRFAISDACFAAGKPLISAAIRGFSGQLATFKPYLGAPNPCYRCFVSAHPDDERGCADTGVISAIAGIMGSLQALEAIKEILHLGKTPADTLWLFDGLTLASRQVHIARDPQCESCGSTAKPIAARHKSG